MVTDGNATSPSTGNPMFILRPEDGGQGASIFTVSTLDISDGLFYRISVIASNEPLNATQIAGWNGTRQNLDVRIVDVDNNGPTFDSQLPGACGGIGKAVERGLSKHVIVFNPLIATLKPPSNGTSYSNTVIGTLAVDGWAVTFSTFSTAMRGLCGAAARPGPSSLYQM